MIDFNSLIFVHVVLFRTLLLVPFSIPFGWLLLLNFSIPLRLILLNLCSPLGPILLWLCICICLRLFPLKLSIVHICVFPLNFSIGVFPLNFSIDNIGVLLILLPPRIGNVSIIFLCAIQIPIISMLSRLMLFLHIVWILVILQCFFVLDLFFLFLVSLSVSFVLFFYVVIVLKMIQIVSDVDVQRVVHRTLALAQVA